MPKVSVIIPVYNTEKYLERCLNSVISQTLADLEIICINDNSTDNSLELLKKYSLKDKRITIINLEKNSGAATGRNKGIEAAKGEYLAFLDSDDFVDSGFYAQLYYEAKEHNSDIAKGSYKYLKSGFVEESINEKIRENKNNFCSAYCSAIFRANLIKDNNIRFPSLRDMEDPPFTLACAVKANNIQIVDNLYVYIEEREDSLTGQPLTEEIIKDKAKGLELIEDIAGNLDRQCYGYVTSIWFGNFFIRFNELDINLKQLIAREIERLYKKILYKEDFCSVLEKYDTLLSQILRSEDYKSLVFYDYIKISNEQKEQINRDNEVISEMRQSNSLFENCYYALANNYVKNNLNQVEDIYFISVVNDYSIYERCVKKNPFVCVPENIKIIDFDNTKENIPVSIRYNSFLNSFDYSKEGWFVFCHCDWELMDNINSVLAGADKNYLYGPIGARIEKISKTTSFRKTTGGCYERRRDGSGFRLMGDFKKDKEISDTFDCQALIVHSSLVKRTNLRFDENLLWDLYTEDFCMQANEKYNIKSYALNIKCCHWSGYHIIPKSYYETLKYINKKYPDSCFAGTVSNIGGLELNDVTYKNYILNKLRKNVVSDLKNKTVPC